MLNPPSTLIIPFGMKSMLQAISHAVLVEQPSNVTEYMADYCTELLHLRKGLLPMILYIKQFHLFKLSINAGYEWIYLKDLFLTEHTGLSIQDLTNLLRFMKGMYEVQISLAVIFNKCCGNVFNFLRKDFSISVHQFFDWLYILIYSYLIYTAMEIRHLL